MNFQKKFFLENLLDSFWKKKNQKISDLKSGNKTNQNLPDIYEVNEVRNIRDL